LPRLFRLKDWLTLEEVGRHLSVLCEEPVTEADILQLALQGRLTLSIRFVNQAHAKVGPVVPLADAKRHRSPIGPEIAELWGLDPAGVTQIEFLDGLAIGNDQVVEIGSDVVSISDVWDLTMLGAERLDVEHQYQYLTGGPAVEMTILDGVLVRSGEIYAQIHEHFSKNEYMDKKNIKDPWSHRDNWYPAGGLPHDAVLVVRAEALDELKRSLVERGDEGGSEKDSNNGGRRHTGGRPMSSLWPTWVAELAALIHEEGIPSGTGSAGTDELIGKIADRLAERALEGPTRTTVQEAAKAVLRRLRDAGK
jgi:hypothetical protein